MNKSVMMNKANEIAKKRNGLLLSKNYKNTRTKLKWKCVNNHIFYMDLSHAQRGQWCKYCNTRVREKVCRLYFEKIFGKDFPKSHPKWLKNPKGKIMELDGYNEDLKIAFEHNGKQHYKYMEFFHDDYENFIDDKNRDKIKQILCQKNNVILIIIPYTIKLDYIQKFIINEYNNKTGKNIHFSKIDYRTFEIYLDKLKIIQDIARKKGGACLSKSYLGANKKLKFKCNNGHIFSSTPNQIKNQGHWCFKCSYRTPRVKTINLQDLVKTATQKNITIMNLNSYKNKPISKIMLSFLCNKCKYQWKGKYVILQNKAQKICPKCNNRAIDIYDMYNLANNHGGFCLSTEYKGMNSKLLWKCNTCGNEWMALPSKIKNGQWCIKCSGKEKLNINDVRQLALKFDGECLSKEYKNIKSKLLWKCKNGHIFEKAPNNIKYKNSFCSICNRLDKKL